MLKEMSVFVRRRMQVTSILPVCHMMTDILCGNATKIRGDVTLALACGQFSVYLRVARFCRMQKQGGGGANRQQFNPEQKIILCNPADLPTQIRDTCRIARLLKFLIHVLYLVLFLVRLLMPYITQPYIRPQRFEELLCTLRVLTSSVDPRMDYIHHKSVSIDEYLYKERR